MSFDFKIFADFQNADEQGRIRLITNGSIEDIKKQGIQLKPGMKALVYCEDLSTIGVVEFSEEEKIWVAVINWDDIKS